MPDALPGVSWRRFLLHSQGADGSESAAAAPSNMPTVLAALRRDELAAEADLRKIHRSDCASFLPPGVQRTQASACPRGPAQTENAMDEAGGGSEWSSHEGSLVPDPDEP
eukprot:TRINITY_DN6816_c3_g1_i1.p3 TRINITY_DN6816_c3_g1~~TRINITY_DN6816_c3_g1_i1.p3  ORF type:complete len:110 (+),score=12.74 TRINITY_DN6816_c3_g1_i1:65-394(+)